MDGGAWWTAVPGVAKSGTRLSTSLHSLLTLSLERGKASHSSPLAWRIPWAEEPARPRSMGLQGVGHNWSDYAAAAWSLSFRPFLIHQWAEGRKCWKNACTSRSEIKTTELVLQHLCCVDENKKACMCKLQNINYVILIILHTSEMLFLIFVLKTVIAQ